MMKKVVVGTWSFIWSGEIFRIEDGVIEWLSRDILPQWSEVFVKEETWVQKEIGVPSLIVRIDGTLRRKELFIFEVEERPAGIGICTIFSPHFREKFDEVRRSWPEVVVIASSLREGRNDDHLWAKVFWGSQEFSSVPPFMVLVRAEPNETNFCPLASYSISTVKAKGDKSYGLNFGWWNVALNPEELPWEDGFVLKPFQGSKMRGVHIWPPRHLKSSPGASTRSKIIEALSLEKYFIQPFKEPERLEIEGKLGWRMLRLYFGFNMSTRNWIFIGGIWTWRPNLRIHGASDAVMGPVEV